MEKAVSVSSIQDLTDKAYAERLVGAILDRATTDDLDRIIKALARANEAPARRTAPRR